MIYIKKIVNNIDDYIKKLSPIIDKMMSLVINYTQGLALLVFEC